MATWIYSHGLFSSYEWLLTQKLEDVTDRGKLDLNKPFVEAATAGTESDRLCCDLVTPLLTGEFGAGTLGYNSALYKSTGRTLARAPGWTAD